MARYSTADRMRANAEHVKRDEKKRPLFDFSDLPLPRDIIDMLPSGAYWVMFDDTEFSYSVDGQERTYDVKRKNPPQRTYRSIDYYSGASVTGGFRRYGLA